LFIRHSSFPVVSVIFAFFAAQGWSGEAVQKSGKAVLKLAGESIHEGDISLRLSGTIKITVSITGGANLAVEPVRQVVLAREWHEQRRSNPETVRLADGSYRWEQHFYLDAAKPGEISLAVAPLRFRDPPIGASRRASAAEDWQEIKWAPIVVRVTTDVRKADLGELRDIAPPEEPPPKPSPVGFVLISVGVVLCVCLLIGAGEYWRRRMARKPAIPADQWALGELDLLKKLNLATRQDIERFHWRLADILREYFERRFQLPATFRTTVELFVLVQATSLLPETQRKTAAELFERCDLVKFAGVCPPAEECSSLAARARGLIEETGRSE
jgi:hypothetical protein